MAPFFLHVEVKLSRFSFQNDSRSWKNQREFGAFAQFAFNFQFTPMPLHDMLHNGQSQASAARLSGTASIYSVKPFSQARQML